MLNWKITLVSLLALIMMLPVQARQRSESEVEDVARSVLLRRTTANSKALLGQVQRLTLTASTEVLSREVLPLTGEAFYICRPQDSGVCGFVIVSGDDRMPAVLGMSDDETFDPTDVPDGLKYMLEEYALALQAIDAGTAKASDIFAEADNDLTDSVEPLLGGIKYNQGTPYNLLCPMRTSSSHSVTGCVATAMVQVMKYYQYPTDYCKGTNNYISKTKPDTIKYDFTKTKFDWDNMLDTYTTAETEYTDEETTSAATRLVFARMYLNPTTTRYIVVDSLLNLDSTTFAGNYQLILADANGNFIRPIGTRYTLSSLASKKSYARRSILHSMPGSMADGTYRIYLGVREKGTSVWTYAKRATPWSVDATHLEEDYLTLTKEGSNYTIDGSMFACQYSSDQANAIAGLMYAAGVSVNMQYGSSSSASVSRVPLAMNTHFGYDKDAKYIPASMFSTRDWHTQLQSEIRAKRPVIMRGESETGGGHAFVLDGYRFQDGTPYYHVNWGWGGSSNGYFLASLLKPSEAGIGGSKSNYSHSNAIIVDLTPDDGVDKPMVIGCTGVHLVDTTYALPGSPMKIKIDTVENVNQNTFAGSIDLYIVDSAGQETKLSTLYTTTSLGSAYFYPTKSLSYTVPSSMPFGNYTFRVKAATSAGAQCTVYLGYTDTLHVVSKSPSDTKEGLLQYVYDDSTMTARVTAYSTSRSVTSRMYKGDIVIPDTVSHNDKIYQVIGIADSAFMSCGHLKSVTLPVKATTLGRDAFNACRGLKSIVLPEGLTVIREQTFLHCDSLQEVTLPDACKTIENYAFSACDQLETVNFGSGLQSIAANAFYNTTGLTHLTFPASLTEIGMRAFYGCTGLTEVHFPAGVTEIGRSSFYGCTGLQNIYMEGVTPPTLSSSAFNRTNDCPIHVPKGTAETYKSAKVWVNYADRIVDDLTAIRGVAVDKSTLQGTVYDLQGRRIAPDKMVKGSIYIIAGRKILYK